MRWIVLAGLLVLAGGCATVKNAGKLNALVPATEALVAGVDAANISKETQKISLVEPYLEEKCRIARVMGWEELSRDNAEVVFYYFPTK